MTLSTIERVLFLRGVELFDQIASEDLVSVAQVCEEVSFAAGTQFITQGEPGDSLYILVDGEVNILMEGMGTVYHRGSKSVIGEMAIISRTTRSAHCVAVTDIALLRVDNDSFWALMEERPKLTMGVIRVLSRRLDEANNSRQQLEAARRTAI